MIEMILPDGSVRKLEKPMTVVEFAKTIGSSLGKATVGAVIDGVQVDPSYLIEKPGTIEIITATSEKGLEITRHSAAHIMAQAVQRLFPGTKVTIGPVIENGFFYDFDPEKPFTEEDLDKIEKEMEKIVKENYEFKRSEMTAEDAKKMFAEMGEDYKIEIIDDLGVDKVSIYQQGEFVDLCRGTHIPSTGYLKAFKLMSTAGAYWRGDSNKKMLQRIYGVAFATKKELDEYLKMMEEAEKRDHRKLGKELGIFMISDLVGKGFPMWLPNGFLLRRALSDYIMDKELKLGYKHVLTPSLGSVDLYKTSGHWDHYKDDMFPAIEMDNEAYVLRPMNCPHHMMIYKNFLHSYHDLPLRMAEVAHDFRYEDSGTLVGLERARTFTQNDSHIFCRPDQIKEEFKGVINLILDTYKDFGFKNYKFRLSLRDPENKEKYFENDELWNKSENELREVLTELGVDFYEARGEAAFYGPKLDVQVISALGHDITLSTCQLDYQLPEKFELEYVDENGDKVRPVVIHRAIFGTLDRVVAFLLEETKGNLPVWLAPVQVKILPISDKFIDEAKKVYEACFNADLRVELDDRAEKIGYKIREAQTQKIPYMLIVGAKEVETNTVSIRKRGEGEIGALSIDDTIAKIKAEIANKGL